METERPKCVEDCVGEVNVSVLYVDHKSDPTPVAVRIYAFPLESSGHPITTRVPSQLHRME